MAAVVDGATSYPGDTGMRPKSVAPIAEILRQWGYCTVDVRQEPRNTAVGDERQRAVRPLARASGVREVLRLHRWREIAVSTVPRRRHDRTRGAARSELSLQRGHHGQGHRVGSGTRSITPDRPFFMYYASGGAHPPHTPPKEWLDKYKGQFDQGWDKLREEILARQIKMGLMKPGTKLAENPPEIATLGHALGRRQEGAVPADGGVCGLLANTRTCEIGRLIQAIDDLGELDNTIVIYIAGDNGGTAIGGLNGTFNEWSNLNGAPEDIPVSAKTRMDEYGGPSSYPNYAVGWAMAGSTPATWCINACQGGGQNQGMVVRWPKGIKAKGEIRRQYTHLIDVAPTILEAAGIPEPKMVNGVEQIPMAGVSMSYSFDDAKAKDRHVTQYNECTGNRSIYHDGWMACVMHRAPWEGKPRDR